MHENDNNVKITKNGKNLVSTTQDNIIQKLVSNCQNSKREYLNPKINFMFVLVLKDTKNNWVKKKTISRRKKNA